MYFHSGLVFAFGGHFRRWPLLTESGDSWSGRACPNGQLSIAQWHLWHHTAVTSPWTSAWPPGTWESWKRQGKTSSLGRKGLPLNTWSCPLVTQNTECVYSHIRLVAFVGHVNEWTCFQQCGIHKVTSKDKFGGDPLHGYTSVCTTQFWLSESLDYTIWTHIFTNPHGTHGSLMWVGLGMLPNVLLFIRISLWILEFGIPLLVSKVKT